MTPPTKPVEQKARELLKADIEKTALALAKAHDRLHRDDPLNHGAVTAYRAGVGMTIRYWNTLARAALNADGERIRRLEEALAKAGDKFDLYAQLHRLKCTAEGDEKADRNQEMADYCRSLSTPSKGVG